MASKIIFNGKLIGAGTPIVRASSPGLRYGDGCFETMRMVNGEIPLQKLHFERLFASMETLRFVTPSSFSAASLEKAIHLLVKENSQHTARIRLMVLRTEEGMDHVIESEPLEITTTAFNEKGLVLGIYPDVAKPCDQFSHIKSNSYQPYRLAASWAKQNDCDDAIVLNAPGRVADTSIANLFIVADGIIKTPALTEGCVGGVMRKYLLQRCRKEGLPVMETTITPDELQHASEVFLTNAVRGIRWVQRVGENNYGNQVSKMLSGKFLEVFEL
jgi:branched-chain amino acid aminotransferase